MAQFTFKDIESFEISLDADLKTFDNKISCKLPRYLTAKQRVGLSKLAESNPKKINIIIFWEEG